MSTPTPPPASGPGGGGRGPGGRFGPGNRFGRGNPQARRVGRLRAELLRTVTPADLRDVVAGLLAAAKAGDVPAARELLQRLLGPPVELDLLERLEALEARLARHEDPAAAGGSR